MADNDKNDKLPIDENLYQDNRDAFYINYKYVDKINGQNNTITDKLKEDISNDKLQILLKFQKYSNSFKNLIQSLYTDIKVDIENDSKTNFPKIIKPNENFKKKEFIELWKKINVKTSYEVDFNSDELIDNVVKELDNNLVVSKTIVKITEGGQNEYINYDGIKKNTSLSEGEVKRIVEDTTFNSSVI